VFGRAADGPPGPARRPARGHRPDDPPWLMEAGVRVDDSPFRARGPIATAGGCLASQYLAAWAMVRGAGWAAAGGRCTTRRRSARRTATSSACST
jgi:hypothetical protein